MRYPASETAERHERILAEAARLFRERGFSGAGVAEIMQAAGLTHGAFYAHFDSKEALAAEATGRALAQTGERVRARADGAADPERAFLDGYLSATHRDRPGEGCAIAALGPEIARHPAVRAPFTREVGRMVDGLAERLARKDGTAPRRAAIRLLSAAVGALILARAVDDPALSDEILEAVREGPAPGRPG